MEWTKESFLSIFDQMDKVQRVKDKYILFVGFTKGIVFSDDDDKTKLNDLVALLDAFDESLHKELGNFKVNNIK